MSYSLHYPDNIVFGPDTVSRLPEFIPAGATILLVTGNHAVRSGLRKRLLDVLEDFHVIPFTGIASEPPLDDVDKIIQTGRKSLVSAVIAAGGGSVIDAAKAAACLIPKPGLTTDYFYKKREITGKGLWFAALPTTAGTGAEITKNSVLTDPDTHIKQSVRHPFMTADLAICDPTLTLSASPELTAASGLDAYTQAVESYVTKNASNATRVLALKAVELIYHYLPLACNDGGNLEYRTQVAEGSMLSAMAFSQSGLGAVHGLAHPIGSLLKIPHGLTCAILLPEIVDFNLPECREGFRELAGVTGGTTAEDFPEITRKLCRKLNIPENFKASGLEEKHFPFILENCRSNSMRGNPREMPDPEVLDLLKKLS